MAGLVAAMKEGVSAASRAAVHAAPKDLSSSRSAFLTSPAGTVPQHTRSLRHHQSQTSRVHVRAAVVDRPRTSQGGQSPTPPPASNSSNGTWASSSISGQESFSDVPRKLRVGDITADVKRIRAQMEQDEQLSSLMAGLRGQNLRDEQFADANVQMRLVEVGSGKAGEDDALPLVYDPDLISAYWGKRPGAVTQRIAQLLKVSGSFLFNLTRDAIAGRLGETEVQRAAELREIVTSLGPAYIKLGQALSIRPDVLSPAAMVELQKLCDKVPSFDSEIAMKLIEEELGVKPEEIFSELTPAPIAAASLGQVYKGRLRSNGDQVAVKVQRPYVLETVTIDLFIIRRLGLYVKKIPQLASRIDVVGLVDEWAARFFEELDYVNEGRNATLFAASMAKDLPQVVVPRTYEEYTSRRVLVSEWIDGEKLSQSTASDVGALVNIGVICYLKQLLDTGLFHADPHPGNLIRTPDGRLCVLDFGLMTRITEDQKYGMIEAISHLIHRDYQAIVNDFVLLGFIPEGVDLSPILPVLARVFDTALEGGGAKGINFQELAADLAQITFEYPFRIPPYFALIIRAIGVLEGIALVGDPDFAIVDAAYPYIAQRLLTDPSPRLRAALRYTIYGRSNVFDADRFIDVMQAFETFAANAQAGTGASFADWTAEAESSATGQGQGSEATANTSLSDQQSGVSGMPNSPSLPIPTLVSPDEYLAPLFSLPSTSPSPSSFSSQGMQLSAAERASGQARAALAFILSPRGAFFRDFILDEVVKGVDAFAREQVGALLTPPPARGSSSVPAFAGLMGMPPAFPSLPLLSPFMTPGMMASVLVPPPFQSQVYALLESLAPKMTEEDRAVLYNLRKVVWFLTATTGEAAGLTSDSTGVNSSSTGSSTGSFSVPSSSSLPPSSSSQSSVLASLLERQMEAVVFSRELAPLLPSVAAQMLPELVNRLSSRVTARFIREVFLEPEGYEAEGVIGRRQRYDTYDV